MNLEAELNSLTYQATLEIWNIAAEMMTDYTRAGVQPRDKFTEDVLLMLSILTGNAWNPDGSFTAEGAEEALGDEARFTSSSFQLQILVFHRLSQLERGATDYKWLEAQWKNKWSKWLFSVGEKQLAWDIGDGIKAGKHRGRTSNRQYVGSAVDEYAPIMANEIDKMLIANLPLRRV